MARTRYIRKADGTGRMAGSIGPGRSAVPTAARTASRAEPAPATAPVRLDGVRAALTWPRYDPRIGNACVAAGCTTRPRKRHGICAYHCNELREEYRSQIDVDPERIDTLIAAVALDPADHDAQDILRRVIRIQGQPLTRDHLTWLATRMDAHGYPWVFYVDLTGRSAEVRDTAASVVTQVLVNTALDDADATGLTWSGMDTAAAVVDDEDAIQRILDHPWQLQRLARSLASNPNLTRMQVNQLAESNFDAIDGLAANPCLSGPQMDAIADLPDAPGRANRVVCGKLLRNPEIPEELVRRIWERHHDSAVVQNAMSTCTRAPADLLHDVLERSSSFGNPHYCLGVAKSVAEHPNADPAVRAHAQRAMEATGIAAAPIGPERRNDPRLVLELDTLAERQAARRLLDDGWHGTFTGLLHTARLLSA
jgi:hypothetical protein